MPITILRESRRIYLEGLPFALKDRAKDELGAKWDADRRMWWVGSARAEDVQKFVAGANAAPATAPDESVPDSARVYAKVRYKGRTYFVVAEAHAKGRARLTTLDGQVAFWADMADMELIKTYAPREYRGQTQYTTIGSIRRFVERERANRDAGGEVCAECGRSGDLVADLEDGLLKHRACCDIEP